MKKIPHGAVITFYALTLLLISILFLISFPLFMILGIFSKKIRVYYLSYMLLWKDEMNRVSRVIKKIKNR